MNAKFPRLISISLALTAVLTLIIGLDLTPWLRGGYGWRWNYDPAALGRTVLLVAVTLIYVVGGWALIHRKSAAFTLIWALIGTVALSLGTTYAHYGNPLPVLFARTLDVTTTGQHDSALQLDWENEQWRDWSDFMRQLDGHIALSPPGGTFVYGTLNATLENTPTLAEALREPLFGYQCHNYAFINMTPAQQATTWFGILLPLWSALTVLPLYAAAKRLIDEQGARWAVLWWALVPGLAGFSASWNTLYPLLAITALWCLQRGFSGKPPWFIAAGLITGLALFTNFAFVPLPAVFGFYTLGYYWFHERENQPIYRPVIVGLWFGLGLLIPWMAFFIPTGETPFDMLNAALDYHFDLERPYWFWLGMHVWDWLLWAGLAFSLLSLGGIITWARQRTANPPLLALSTVLTIIIIALSDTARGETGRVWLFLSPFLVIAAVDAVKRLSDGPTASLRAITALQAAATVILVATVPVMGYPPSQKPAIMPPVADTQPINAMFSLSEQGEVFQLTGWRGDTQDNAVMLDFVWEGEQHTVDPLWFGAFLIGPDGTLTEPTLWQPGQINGDAARYPTTCWADGQAISDSIRLPLPDEAVNGDWWVSLAVFGDAAMPEGRLQVTYPDASSDVQVGLGPIRVD